MKYRVFEKIKGKFQRVNKKSKKKLKTESKFFFWKSLFPQNESIADSRKSGVFRCLLPKKGARQKRRCYQGFYPRKKEKEKNKRTRAVNVKKL